MVGLHEARCWYLIRSVFVCREYTLDACVVMFVVAVLGVPGFIGVSQRPVGQ